MALRIAEGQVVPVDARVMGGAVEVDLAVVSGESTPVVREPGTVVCAGAVPVSGPLVCEALRTARESTLERLAELARSLRARRAPLQRVADRLAAWLVPLVWVVALASVAWWAPRVGLGGAVAIGLAVVLAACPCSYGVATPLALWVALRRALASGVLIRSAAVLEELARVRAVAFDKTGTLTHGELAVTAIEPASELGETAVLALAAGLAGDSPHPVARAIAAAAIDAGAAPAAVHDRCVGARGVRGRDRAGRELRLGSAAFAGAEAGRGARAVLARDGALLARFYLVEAARDDAAPALAALRAQGIAASMATGDDGPAARSLADRLGIEGAFGLSPAAKVARLQALGRAHGVVAMVGEGINDAPALAGLGPSFAMPGATGLARGVAGAVLLADELTLVPHALALARRARRVIVGNLVWATAYNAIFVAIAAAGMLRPVWAALAMLVSSVVVVGRAMWVAEAKG
jgi:heavy metal translocating P-type ATPase